MAFVSGHTAVPDVLALSRRLVIVPDHVAGTGIDGPDIVRDCEVQNAIDEQRGGLDGRVLIRLELPGQAESSHIPGRDLVERTVAPAGIIAVVSRPGIRRGMQKRAVVRPLRQKFAGRGERKNCSDGDEKCMARKLHIEWSPLQLVKKGIRST